MSFAPFSPLPCASLLTDDARIRYQVVSAVPMDYKSEANKLAELIKQMSVE